MFRLDRILAERDPLLAQIRYLAALHADALKAALKAPEGTRRGPREAVSAQAEHELRRPYEFAPIMRTPVKPSEQIFGAKDG